MTKAYSYCRVSYTEQQEGYSIDAQSTEGRLAADRQGIEVVREWRVVESAKEQGRKAFNELVRAAKANPSVKVILFEKPDRMTRNLHDLVALYDLIENHDKEIYFFKTGLRVNKNSRSSDQLQLDLQVILARNYINNLREEVLKGMTEKVKRGGFPGVAPVGFLNNKATREIEIDLERAPLVKRLFELYATGRYSIDDLTKLVQEWGLRHPLGSKPLTRSAVFGVLKNVVYYGLVRWRGMLVPGIHKPIISKALYDRVQAVMGSIHRPKTKDIAFGGMAECGHCGSSITVERHTKKFKNGTKRKYSYYRCTAWKNGKVCKGSYIREEELTRQLAEPLKSIWISADVLGKIQGAIKESFGAEKAYHAERLAALRAEETKLKNRIEQAYTDRVDGVLTVDEYRERAGGWRERQMAIREEIRRHELADTVYLEEASRILELAQKAHQLYLDQPDLHEKRKLIDLVVSKVVISDNGAVWNLKEPFQTLSKVAQDAKSGNGHPGWYPSCYL